MIKCLFILTLFLYSNAHSQSNLDSTIILYDSLGTQFIQQYYSMEDTADILKRDNANLKRQLEVAMQKLSLYEEDDLEKEGFFALKSMVKQQIDIVMSFKLKDEITKSPKDDKYYDRVKALSEGLKTMITDLKILRVELKINPNEEKEEDMKRRRVITAESIADHVNELAGKNNN